MDRILLVEDDAVILRGLCDNLRWEAYEVLTAADGETGYRLIREQRPDLIVLDLMLPARLLEVVRRNQSLTAESMRDAIHAEVSRYADGLPPSDDLTLIVGTVL